MTDFPIQLKGGFGTSDPRLGRVPQFDVRNKDYNVRKILSEDQTIPVTNKWNVPQYLNQGDQPSCVGFAWSHELCAAPKKVVGITNQTAYDLYKKAQTLDEWPKENYDGSSTLGGVKACQELGFIGAYYWAENAEEVALAISYKGVVVIGINWFDKMFTPNADGIIVPEGNLAGGHEILVRGYNAEKKMFLLHNSWGLSWGISGGAWISYDDLDYLLSSSQQGDACVPTERFKNPHPDETVS